MADALTRLSALSFLALAAALPWSVAPMSVALVLCASLTLTVWWLPRGPRWVRTPVDLPALAWLGALVLASTFAHDPGASWPRVTKGFLLLLVPVAAYHAREKTAARRAVAVLLLSGGLAAVFAIARFVAQGSSFPHRVKGAVGHPLTYGGQAMLLAAMAAAIAIRGRGRWRAVALLLLAVLLPALAGTYTRSAWLGFIAAAAVIVGFTRARWLPALAVVLALLLAIAPGVYHDRAFSILDPRSPWNAERVHMWEAGIRMFRDHPWTGVGLSDLHAIYERYKSPGAIEPAGHLHSVPVHVAATMGLPGLIALLALVAGLWRAAWGGFRERRGGLGATLKLGVTAGLVGFLVSGLFEWNFGDEELLDLLYVMVGLAYAAGAWPVRVESRTVNPSEPSRSGGGTTPPTG